jgi:hypothetical protein
MFLRPSLTIVVTATKDAPFVVLLPVMWTSTYLRTRVPSILSALTSFLPHLHACILSFLYKTRQLLIVSPIVFTSSLLTVLEYYADLAALLFEPEDFYPGTAIHLRVMPPYDRQSPFFHNFNQRTSRKFTEMLNEGRQITLQEARLAVWQDLETELLAFPWDTEQPE